MAVTSGLAITAIQARDAARDQRREAEGLIGFMLGDLKDKLEPIGKLDALDGVGARVLAYYQKQDTSELTDAALLQRSRALSLMGEVAILRGDLDGASRLYREASAGTAEAIRRNPDDPQRLYDHAQNQFYFADIAMRRGQIDNAEAAFREYKRLADRMVELAPDNMKWRMEVQNADANLATVLTQRRRFNEAATQWAQAYRMIDALATADPNNSDYQKSLVESIAWYADAESDAGHIDSAIALRLRNVDLLTRLASRTQDVNYQYRLIPAERALGKLYAFEDKMDLALQHMRTAVAQADRLAQIEPDNAKWLGYGAKAKSDLTDLLLRTGALAEAREANEASCDIVDRLLRKVGNQPDWRAGLRDCWLRRAQLANAEGSKAEALRDSERAVEIAKTVKTTDQFTDRYFLGRAYRLLGDMRRSAGDAAGATAAWQTALSVLPTVTAERPSEMRDRADILRRAGRDAEARPLESKLAAMGYKYAAMRT
jgi:tetratricopeptide (TPR) repeat protein